MGKEYIPLFLDFNDTTQDLSDEECGRLVRAMIDYANDNEEYESRLTGAEKIAFRFIKGFIDRNSAVSEARQKAGRSKKEQSESNGNKTEQNESNENKTEQNESNSLTNTKTKIETKTKTETKTETESKTKANKTESFAKFWNAYPRHEAKAKAEQIFSRLNPSPALLEQMLSAISRSKQSEQWQESGGKFIPLPTTWLNQRRWEDEPMKTVVSFPKNTTPAAQYEQREYRADQEETLDEMMARLAGMIGEAQ